MINVDSVTSPEEALARLQTGSYDCIVSDYQMPRLNGIELAKKIRELSDIPFILYTGRASEEVVETAFEVGINDYLRKELNPSPISGSCQENKCSASRAHESALRIPCKPILP